MRLKKEQFQSEIVVTSTLIRPKKLVHKMGRKSIISMTEGSWRKKKNIYKLEASVTALCLPKTENYFVVFLHINFSTTVNSRVLTQTARTSTPIRQSVFSLLQKFPQDLLRKYKYTMLFLRCYSQQKVINLCVFSRLVSEQPTCRISQTEFQVSFFHFRDYPRLTSKYQQLTQVIKLS